MHTIFITAHLAHNTQTQVQEQRAEWAALELKLKGHLDATGTSAEQLRWALSIVRSRAFAAPYVPVPLSVAPKLLATATVASAAVTAAAGTAAGAGVIALGTAAAAGLYAWLMRSAATQEQHALCPLMDLFNHDGRQQVHSHRICSHCTQRAVDDGPPP
jgi:hypothetical protein